MGGIVQRLWIDERFAHYFRQSNLHLESQDLTDLTILSLSKARPYPRAFEEWLSAQAMQNCFYMV